MIGTRLPRVERIGLAVLLLAVVATPLLASRSLLHSMTLVGVLAVAVIGLNLLLGLAGQVSFAQTTFMAIGGYGSAILPISTGMNPWLALVVAAAAAVLVALVIGVPLLRLSSHYLAMASFTLALGTASLATAAVGLTNGSIGIADILPLSLGSLTTADSATLYCLVWLVCGAALLVFHLLARSHIGRAWRALATREDVAASLGVDVTRHKLLAFATASLMASVAGSLYAQLAAFVSPDHYNVSLIIDLFLMLFVGGLGSLIGPVVGTAVVVLLPLVTLGTSEYQELLFLVVLLVVILLRPTGLFGRATGVTPLSALLPAALRRAEQQPAAAERPKVLR